MPTSSTVPLRTVPLRTGQPLPLLGFGTYLMKQEAAVAPVAEAIRVGYRHVDTAEIYNNEEAVGRGIRQGIADAGIDRDAVFVTTKLWPGKTKGRPIPTTNASVAAALEASLTRLQLDSVDLYLIHAPFDPVERIAQWEGMVRLQEEGKAKAIGVSNFSQTHLDEIAASGLPLPDANQIELHPWSQKPSLVAHLRKHQIQPIAYSSLVPLSTWRTATGQRSAKTDAMRAEGRAANNPFNAMAKKYGVTEAQVLLKWGLQMSYPILPKSTKPERIRSNADLFSFEIDADDMALIATMDRGDGLAWSAGDPTALP